MLWPPPFPSAPLPLLPQVREPLPGRYSLEDVNGQQADVVAGPAEATRYGCGAAVYVVDKVWGGYCSGGVLQRTLWCMSSTRWGRGLGFRALHRQAGKLRRAAACESRGQCGGAQPPPALFRPEGAA